jgi:hypothetical protein
MSLPTTSAMRASDQARKLGIASGEGFYSYKPSAD